MQLIVFFDRETFSDLLENHGRNPDFKTRFSRMELNKETGNPEPVYFDTNNSGAIIYIDKNGKAEIDVFDQVKAVSSSILMIPDEMKIEYVPNSCIKILRHNTPPVGLSILKESIFFTSPIHQNEERFDKTGVETLYYRLVLFIGNNENLTFDQFLKDNNISCNPKLEAALDFLNDCLIKKPDLNQLKGFDTETVCITGKAKGRKLEKLWENLKQKPLDDIDAFEAFRDGVLEKAGVGQ
ncbi:MAG: hypothetical protein IH598_12875 [Bacteroidales bacterium]|nr:hypothetical protein [Bacteroidales bacterium]